MIFFKTEEELEIMHSNAMLASNTITEIAKVLKSGITTLSLDELADEFIRDHGAVSSFYNFQGYPFHICTSINDVIVQGPPSKRTIQEGDVVSIDVGVLKNEFYGEHVYTFIVGETTPEILKLRRIAKESLFAGLEEAFAGNHMGEICSAIQHYNEKKGYGVIRESGGHAIGRSMHELPEVPNYGRRGTGIEMRQNLVLAIEPLVNLGTQEIIEDKDGSYRTADGLASVHFEHIVCIKPEKGWILTDFDPIEKAEKANKNLNASYDE
ncbi:MAG: type I methionyl aminopeptidase [Pedobacter sp.]|uniref:type I methionyl aminopeptidase n=1 Tax=Pedobacter sp. TaxID=1411316 RepID=UPI003390F991